jgi:AbrB family looped-hinge helix DNA binding protein
MRYAVYLLLAARTLRWKTLPESTVTEKFQITIPKEIREEMELKPGEKVIVEKNGVDSILVRPYRKMRQPLKHLIGKKRYHRRVSIEELEEKIERR